MNSSGDRIFLAAFILFFPISLSAETTLSFFVAPSFPFQQDIKTKTYDTNQNLIGQNFLEADSYAGVEAGGKIAHFFHKNFGAEWHFSYNRIRTDLKGADSKFNNTSMRQERYSLLLSFLGRKNFNYWKISELYLGFGLGAVYSDFDFIPKEWGMGGKLFLGADFFLADRVSLFFESQYFWAPDVGGSNQALGENLKTSGAPNYNFSNKLFGPHHDTQFLSLIIGTKFKL